MRAAEPAASSAAAAAMAGSGDAGSAARERARSVPTVTLPVATGTSLAVRRGLVSLEGAPLQLAAASEPAESESQQREQSLPLPLELRQSPPPCATVVVRPPPRELTAPSPAFAFPRRALSATAQVRAHAPAPPAVVAVRGASACTVPAAPGAAAAAAAATTAVAAAPATSGGGCTAATSRPVVVSVPLLVLQTLPGINHALLAAFLRAEACDEFEQARVRGEDERRRLAATGTGRPLPVAMPLWPPRLPGVLARWAQRRRPSVRLPGGGVAAEPPAAPLASRDAPSAPANAAAAAAAAASAAATPVPYAPRRRRSFSGIADAVLASRHAPLLSSSGGLQGGGATAVAGVPAAPGSAAPGTGAAAGRHRYALSSEPVLALTQLHAALHAAALEPGAPGARSAAAAAEPDVDVTS